MFKMLSIRVLFLGCVFACLAASFVAKNQRTSGEDANSLGKTPGESSFEPYSLKLLLEQKEIFLGQPLYFSIVAASSPLLKENNEFEVFGIATKALETNKSKRGFVITEGRTESVRSSQTTLYGTSYDITWISVNNGVDKLNPLNKTGAFTCRASASLMNSNRQIFKVRSDYVTVKVREPTERESSIVALLDKYKVVSETYSTNKSKHGEMLIEYAGHLRKELQDPNVPLREELTVKLIDMLSALISRIPLAEDRDHNYKEQLTLMMTIHPSHTYLRWSAYTGAYNSEGPVRIFRIMSSFKDREPTFDFPWDKLLEQWREEMPIQPQISKADIDEYYTPSMKMIETMAEKYNSKAE
jgi:hypothetical protein